MTFTCVHTVGSKKLYFNSYGFEFHLLLFTNFSVLLEKWLFCYKNIRKMFVMMKVHTYIFSFSFPSATMKGKWPVNTQSQDSHHRTIVFLWWMNSKYRFSWNASVQNGIRIAIAVTHILLNAVQFNSFLIWIVQSSIITERHLFILCGLEILPKKMFLL